MAYLKGVSMLSVLEAIKSRYSVRTFKEQPLSREDLDYTKTVMSKAMAKEAPFGNKVRFELVDKDPNNSGKAVGTYGIIKNAQKYIVAIVENKEEALVDVGYLFEYIVIALTQKGIGTCWLGGTFKREMFLNHLDIPKGAIIPIVIPIGYPADAQRMFEKVMRFAVKANDKKPWNQLFFDRDNKPLVEGSIGKLEVAFEAVRLGPSASNKQPWRLVYDSARNRIYHFIALDPKYTGNKMGFSMQHIDGGIAMYQFESIVKFMNITGKWVLEDVATQQSSENLVYIKTYKILE